MSENLKWFNVLKPIHLGIEEEDVFEFTPKEEREYFNFGDGTEELYIQLQAPTAKEAYERMLDYFVEFDVTRNIKEIEPMDKERA